MILPGKPRFADEAVPATSIGENAFRDTSIRSIYIPPSAISLGDASFAGCQFLTPVVFVPRSSMEMEMSLKMKTTEPAVDCGDSVFHKEEPVMDGDETQMQIDSSDRQVERDTCHHSEIVRFGVHIATIRAKCIIQLELNASYMWTIDLLHCL
jgi:hypothetical protein